MRAQDDYGNASAPWPVPLPIRPVESGPVRGGRPAPPFDDDNDDWGEPRRKDLREYVSMFRRRWFQIVAVSVLLLLLTGLVAMLLPSLYRSSATIRVQEQEIPPELVRSTITSFADERIQVISQQVMTGAVLQDIIEKYSLYPALRERMPMDGVIERMRRDIRLTTVDANMSDRLAGRRMNATIAFKISFDYAEPKAAQQVTNELITLYLAENEKARRQSVAETTAFLSQESKRLAEQIRSIETSLAEFKRRNAGRTPDSSAVNLQFAERTDAELMRVEREISTIQDRRASLEAQIALVSPNLSLPPVAGLPGERVTTNPADRLRALQAQLATTSASYGAEHPDVRRLQREISAIRAQLGVDPDGPEAKIEALERELLAARSRYSDEHPDVQRLRRALAAARAGPRDSPSVRPADRAPAAPTRPDNPAYVALSSQIESAKREVTQLMALRDDLRAKQRSYDARLIQIPEVERQYRELTRDYENAQTRYREIRAKEMQAQVAQELELDRKAERFQVLEPANLPYGPVSPDRLRIALMGLVGSLGAGFGLAWLREALDPSVKGPLDLARIAAVPILTSIPYIETRHEILARRWRRLLGLLVVLGLFAAVLAAVHHFYRPVPELLDSLVRRIPLS